MTWELSFQSEPFAFPEEKEWENETTRSDPDYIRWVQASLNRILGLRLAVDSIEGPATRSAIRSFQQRNGLTVDGIVGPNTEAAIRAVGVSRPPARNSVANGAGRTPPSYIPEPNPNRAACHAPRDLCKTCVILDNFDLDKYTLKPEHFAKIVEIADQVIESQITARPIRSMKIVGHADPSGSSEHNQQLALNRALAVKTQLDALLRTVKPTIRSHAVSRGEAPIRGVSEASRLRRVDVCLQSTFLKWFETCGMQPVRGGNDVEYFIDGQQTFTAMHDAIKSAKGAGHYIYLLGWWLSDDHPLVPSKPDSTIQALFRQASSDGVQIRVMLWDYPSRLGSRQNLDAVTTINDFLPNGAGIIDGRTLNFGSHHQKILIVKGKEGLIAFCGGVDINPDRVMNTGRNLGEPFHDVHCRIKGPAAYDLLKLFTERWQKYPGSAELDRKKDGTLLGSAEPEPQPQGRVYVQIGRTYPNGTWNKGMPHIPGIPIHEFAPDGEQTARRMILKAICEARRFIYIEDQYLVSMEISRALLAALPHIQHLTILIPHGDITDLNPPIPIVKEWREQVYYRREQFITPLRAAAPDKVRVFFLSPVGGRGTYVHSKMMVVDDEFAIIGSANLCRRSLTHDSEAIAGIFDPSCNSIAKRLRIALWGKHLNIDVKTRAGRQTLEDGVASADLWLAPPQVPARVHVEEYDEKENAEPYQNDIEWNRIDPNGS